MPWLVLKVYMGDQISQSVAYEYSSSLSGISPFVCCAGKVFECYIWGCVGSTHVAYIELGLSSQATFSITLLRP